MRLKCSQCSQEGVLYTEKAGWTTLWGCQGLENQSEPLEMETQVKQSGGLGKMSVPGTQRAQKTVQSRPR